MIFLCDQMRYVEMKSSAKFKMLYTHMIICLNLLDLKHSAVLPK